MKKTKKQMSWREVFQMNIRGLKLFYERYPQMVISRFISVFWNALTPYVGIFLSALVVDELVGNRDIQRLQTLVIITLASAAVTRKTDLTAAIPGPYALSLPMKNTRRPICPLYAATALRDCITIKQSASSASRFRTRSP